jgi:hypothetical protein
MFSILLNVWQSFKKNKTKKNKKNVWQWKEVGFGGDLEVGEFWIGDQKGKDESR